MGPILAESNNQIYGNFEGVSLITMHCLGFGVGNTMTPACPEVIPMIKCMGKWDNHTNVVNGITPGRR